MSAFEFNAARRTETGKRGSRRLRQAKKIPAVLYGAGQSPENIVLELKDVMKTLNNEAVYSHILTLNIDGNPEKVVLKALSRHHIKPEVTHMDFLRIKAGEKIIMHVPLHFKGEEDCPGVKEGGVISHLMKDLEVKCLPESLPEHIEVDVSTLDLDHAIHLSEIRLPEGVELIAEVDEDHDATVVSVHRPRIEKEPEVEATGEKAAGEEAAEGAEESAAEKATGDEEKSEE